MNSAMAALLSKPPVLAVDTTKPVESTPCGKTGWEEGEHYECLMTKGHKAIKCGQHGMVRNITP